MVLGLFGGGKKAGRIRIEFPNDFEVTSKVCVVEDVQMPESTEIWIWSLYYTKQLFNLGFCEHSEGLRGMLVNWAAENIEDSLNGFPEGYKSIDPEIGLIGGPISKGEKYTITVLAKGENLPFINTGVPLKGLQNRAAYSVVAFAEFIAKTRDASGLPATILALNEYFEREGNYTERRTLVQGPLYALQSIMGMSEG